MKPKDEAIKALWHIIDRLKGEIPIDGLGRKQLQAAAEHALEQVQQLSDRRTRKSEPEGA